MPTSLKIEGVYFEEHINQIVEKILRIQDVEP
jgi:hypothetical protein